MKKYIKFVILWFLDKLEWELTRREITYVQYVNEKNKWKGEDWKKIVFYKREKNTGIESKLVCVSNTYKHNPKLWKK